MLRKTGTTTSDANSSDSSDDRNVIGAAGVLAGSAQHEYGGENPYRLDGVRGSYDGERHATLIQQQSGQKGSDHALAAPAKSQYGGVAPQQQPVIHQQQQPVVQQQQAQQFPAAAPDNSSTGNWAVPAAGGVAAGAGAGIVGTEAYRRHQRDASVPATEGDVSPVTPIVEGDSIAAAAVLPTSVPGANDTSASTYAAVPINPTSTEKLAGDAATRRGRPGIIALDESAVPVTALPSKPSFGDRNNIDDILSGASTPAAGIATPPTTTVADITTPATNTAARSADEGLGGNERIGAHETGQLFPRVIRHDTNLSVSALHVPGEFPAR